MDRVQKNQLKRVRRKANNFVNKRLKFSRSGESTRSTISLSIESFPLLRNEAVSNTLNDIQEPSLNESNISNSNNNIGKNKDEHFDKEIASWVVNSGTSVMYVDSLLRILQKKVPSLPITCKTLLKTPKNAYEDIVPLCNGFYLHIGLQYMLKKFLSKHEIISKTIIIDVGIDGVPTTKSSSTELWPFMINVVGYEEVLLVGSYFGYGKPKDENDSSEEFLRTFVTEVLEILEFGGVLYEDKIYELKFRTFVMDAPARAFIMNTIMYSGYHSCTKCIIPGIRISKHIIFYGVDYMLRSNYSFRNRIHSNHHHSNDVTMMEKLPIDCARDVAIDSMHNIYLGVQKQLFTLWLHDRKKPYSISAKNIRLLSQRIFHIAKQLPSEFSRKPRHLKYLKRFKATEFRQFLLYTLILILKDLLLLKYYNHFLKFHCAIRILCTPVDCIQRNALAKELLTDFVKEFGILYGYHNLSHNVHSLLHLSQDVLNYECPLDSYNAFKFENFLQYLKKLCRNNYRVLEQIRNRYIEKFLIDDYKGDFQKRIKKNKTNKFGDFIDVHIYDKHLSVKAPNNYILTNKGYVYKIQKIVEKSDGSFNVIGTRVKSISPFYKEPIPSNLLNIFVSETGITSGTYTVRVTEELRKVGMVECNGKYFYLALLH